MEWHAFVSGADHADKIGKVVILDIDYGTEAHPNTIERRMASGVLTRTTDEFRGADLVATHVVISDAVHTLAWDRNEHLSATISVVEN